MAVRLSPASILCIALLAAGPAAEAGAADLAPASFGVSLRVRAGPVASPAAPAWLAPAGVQELAATPDARYRLFAGDIGEAAARYRAALSAQGYALTGQRDDGRAWTAQWRLGTGQCFEVAAQPVLGAHAVRIVERGRDCGR